MNADGMSAEQLDAIEQRARRVTSGPSILLGEVLAHARQDVPALVAEVRRLTVALAAEQAAHEDTRASLAAHQLLAGRCGNESPRGRQCEWPAGHGGYHQALAGSSVSYVWAAQ